ncbi:S-adenosyl-L-methionine-dependent methyltransferase [Byssothecium circinans]|uniref:S-adenosyl-L-methionine-dependent methyltransferase n=1 Tax=Byssothecium circinans TaxID=147558 RepID=A0A6A5TPC3_9PLEO|nr:S-adenosyl-L-methionine-dependent methyltransferase [Byssothecium circinans]
MANTSSPKAASPKSPAATSSPAGAAATEGNPGEYDQPEVGIEAEATEYSDGDSAYGGDDLESYTTSLKSTVLNYRFENGRRYHGFKDTETQYLLPNDDEENDRLDLYHHIMTLRMDGALHYAPIGEEPGRILDLGTGTGIWAIDMGDKYPSAEVLGNDISPIQPSLVPPNVKFEVDDIEDEWVYSSKFDFIHARYLACSIKDWPKLMKQSFDFVKPGGWVEFQDFDLRFYTTTNGEFTQDTSYATWSRRIAEGVRKFGVEPDPGPQLESWVRAAGFINVESRILPFPVGTWPKDKKLKEMGAFNLISYLDNLEGLSLRIYTTALGWQPEEVRVLCSQVRKDFKNPRMRSQHNFYVVWAQRPEV